MMITGLVMSAQRISCEKISRSRTSMVIEEEIKKSSNYRIALGHLRNAFGDAICEHTLGQFTK